MRLEDPQTESFLPWLSACSETTCGRAEGPGHWEPTTEALLFSPVYVCQILRRARHLMCLEENGLEEQYGICGETGTG